MHTQTLTADNHVGVTSFSCGTTRRKTAPFPASQHVPNVLITTSPRSTQKEGRTS